jgi:ATP-dependent DNA helicase PIF1
VEKLIDANLLSRAILSPLNVEVAAINEKILGMVPGEEKQFLSADSTDAESDQLNRDTIWPDVLLNGLAFSGVPPHCLKLKVGAVVILLRNLSHSLGLVNGTRMVVADGCPTGVRC